MNDLYEVLEICLQDIERGESVETILSRYPDYADELRPILEGSVNARNMTVVAPSAEVVRRNRAKVLQHAAQMREAQTKSSSRRIWFVSLRRLAVTLAVVAMLFVSGTGLVRAASTTLPGDNLYPVKRTWEDFLVLFTFNLQQRETLEIEHENERLHELREVFAEGRSAEIEFAGLVAAQNGNEWMIAGFPVVITGQTEVRDGPIMVGSAVRVKGQTQADGLVYAERVRVLPPDAKLPTEVEIETEDHEGGNHQGEDNSGEGSSDEELKDEENQGSGSEAEAKDELSNNGSGDDNSGSDSHEDNKDSSGSDENSGSSNDNDRDDSGGHDAGDDSGDRGGGDGEGGEED